MHHREGLERQRERENNIECKTKREREGHRETKRECDTEQDWRGGSS